jgi:hypothetical protein
MNAHPSILGEEAARCDDLKCGGTYADFVPLIPRDAGRKSMRRQDRWEEGNTPKDDSRPVVPFTIPFDILEENDFFWFSLLREERVCSISLG